MIQKTCILISLLLTTIFAQWSYLRGPGIAGSWKFNSLLPISNDTLLIGGGPIYQSVANDSMTDYLSGLPAVRTMVKYHDTLFYGGDHCTATLPASFVSLLDRQIYSICITTDSSTAHPHPVDTVFVGTDSGVYYSPSDSIGYKRVPRYKYWYPRNTGLTIKVNAVSNLGALIVGTDSGVYWYYQNNWVLDTYNFPTRKKVHAISTFNSTRYVGTDSGFYHYGDLTCHLPNRHIFSFCNSASALFVGTDSVVYKYSDINYLTSYISLGNVHTPISNYKDSVLFLACNNDYIYASVHFIDIAQPTKIFSEVFYLSLNQTSIVPRAHTITLRQQQSFINYFSLNGRKMTPRASGIYIKNTNTLTKGIYVNKNNR